MALKQKDIITVIPFKTYGTQKQVYLKGMVFKGIGFNDSSGLLAFFFDRWKQSIFKKVKDILLEIKLESQSSFSIRTNSEGYYFIDSRQTVADVNLENQGGWLGYNVLVTDKYFDSPDIQFNYSLGEMLIPSKHSNFGVISDIDDTILHTGVSSLFKWQVLVNTFLKPPTERKPIKNIVMFYKMLSKTPNASIFNPFFYVSSSPCNLYEYLNTFLLKYDFPKGPILLRDSRPIGGAFQKRTRLHKEKEINNILDTYPNLKFILIGDCSEYDADLFLKIVNKYPNRISSIYLRAVSHKGKMKQINNLFNSFNDIPYCIFQSSEEAISHARNNGFIN